MFSFGKKKPANGPSNTTAPNPEKKSIESEKVLFGIKEQKQKLEKDIDNISEEIVRLQTAAKKLLAENKKVQAKRIVATIKQKREQIIRKENFITMMQKTEVNIESAMDDMQMGHFLKDANAFLKARVEENDQFIEQISEFKELQDEFKSNNETMMDMFKPDEEEEKALDDELNDLMKEVETEQKMEMNLSTMGQPLNLPQTNAVISNGPAMATQVQKPSQSSSVSNKFESLLGDLV